MKRVVLAVTVALALAAALPAEVFARCQNLQNQTVNLGLGGTRIKQGSADISALKVFTTGDGYSQNVQELNFGWAKTLGYLPAGALYNAWVTAFFVDSSVSGCISGRLDYTAAARSGDTCVSYIDGPWTVSYSQNTCGLVDDYFRGLVQIGFNSLGYAPSYTTKLTLWSGGTQLGVQEGCHKVTQTGGNTGCSDPIGP